MHSQACPTKSVVKLTDCFDMIIAVDWDKKYVSRDIPLHMKVLNAVIPLIICFSCKLIVMHIDKGMTFFT